jgi:23S rRNA (cytidine1920-2'-O)/16S rRNA (cytidine1409-2'-O)-methyltransferase
MAKARVDQLLVEQGLAESRSKAQAYVLAGLVFWGERKLASAGAAIPEDAELTVRGHEHGYVSRGGVKLAGALESFAVDPRGLRCLDLGASTGGFTDCLLQRGAAHVVAVDVGYGQLAHKLRTDARVTNLERTNGRTLTPEIIAGAVDLSVVDASFIGLAKLAEALAVCTRPGGLLVALVKPQFEAGREVVSKGKGVVRDEEERRRCIDEAAAAVAEAGFEVLGTADCVLHGPKGNREAFVHARRKT